ncbi:hypothetical protein BDD12DRAFT_854693 [Trichophaea hybrida]|nr:hypothetical protein BDD12DRAFT_854693 [Trichophaea hybrida]
MPGIYAFQAPSAPPDRDIQVYYNTARYNLAVSLKASVGQDPGLNYAALSTNRKGVIVDTSQLDSTVHNGIRLIVGLTFPELPDGTTDYTNYDVSIVSPMYMPVATASIKSKAVAVCSDGEQAWAFYITGNDDNNLTLSYITVLGGPFVYYQGRDENTLIYEFNQDTGAAVPIKSTNDAIPATPISIALDETGGRLYMYYTDKAHKVRRISRLIKDSGSVWSPSSDVHGLTTAVSPSSQLGVAAIANRRENHILFVPKNSSSLVHFKEPWL